MKKLLIGLLAITGVGVVLLAAGGYFAYRAARPAFDTAREYVPGFGRDLDDLDKKITNQQSFTPPASAELTKDQVERFVRVQNSVRGALGQRVNELESKYRNLKVNADGSRLPSVSEFFSAMSELSGVLTDARRAQVDALNQEKFSAAEYDWVRKEFYQAAGVNTVSRPLGELQRMINSVSDRALVSDHTPINTPEANRELVKPHQRFVDDWLPLLFFGL